MNSQQNLDQHIGIGSEDQTKLDHNPGSYQYSYVSKYSKITSFPLYSPI